MPDLLQSLNIQLPIVQAPMAGVSTPALAAAVCNAGALGSIAVGATDAQGARVMIADLKSRTARAFNVNLFVHAPPQRDAQREQQWISALASEFNRLGVKPPIMLKPAYATFLEDDAMLAALIDTAPAVVSFHFGLPTDPQIRALKGAGIWLIATVTSPEEARAARDAGMDAIIAQGIEAGGHRGTFDPSASDDTLGAMALTRLLSRQSAVPIIAAGGIMDGAGIVAALNLGAVAAQLGTAFIGCPESSADAAYRTTLAGEGAGHTVMTRAISGRSARSLPNDFTALGERLGVEAPDYPVAYDAGKALIAAAKAAGETGFAVQWAGQGAPLARFLPAAELVVLLAEELAANR